MMRMAASVAALVAALGLLSACGLFGGGTTTLPPPDYTQRVGVDRQAPASGLTTHRDKARHDADDPAVDEARGQPVGSIVPAGQPSAKGPPPPAPAEPAPVKPPALPPS